MKFLDSKIEGCHRVELEKHGDERGFFARLFCDRDYKDIESCPTANSLDSEILSLPIGDQLETFEVKQVINEIRNFFKA